MYNRRINIDISTISTIGRDKNRRQKENNRIFFQEMAIV